MNELEQFKLDISKIFEFLKKFDLEFEYSIKISLTKDSKIMLTLERNYKDLNKSFGSSIFLTVAGSNLAELPVLFLDKLRQEVLKKLQGQEAELNKNLEVLKKQTIALEETRSLLENAKQLFTV